MGSRVRGALGGRLLRVTDALANQWLAGHGVRCRAGHSPRVYCLQGRHPTRVSTWRTALARDRDVLVRDWLASSSWGIHDAVVFKLAAGFSNRLALGDRHNRGGCELVPTDRFFFEHPHERLDQLVGRRRSVTEKHGF